jgi:hypothetical protein
MPLIQTYQTDLKSLRYGQDRPGGGSSNQPYHKVNYRKRFEQGTEDLARTGGSNLYIRGGYLLPGRILADEERIGKWLISPEGLSWVGQQQVLSTIGTRIYGGYPAQVRAANRIRLNDGTYNPLSTLLAVAGNAIGGHPNKQGTDPTGLSLLGRPEYIKLVQGGITNTGTFDGISSIANNRLISLYRTKIADYEGSQSTELYSYRGGPQSDKGLQLRTRINAASDRTIYLGSNTSFLTPLFGFSPLSYATFSQGDLEALSYNSSNEFFVVGNGTLANVQDFRKELLVPGTESYISLSPDYRTRNIETRVNLGNPGVRGVNRRNYGAGIPQNYRGLDSLNALYLYKSENVNNTDVRTNDLVKFRIAVIDNDNPNLKTFAHFRSFLNSFDDTMSSTWDSFKYLGRGEDFFNYSGFSRVNNISFTLVAQSIQELSIMYQKLNYIVSSLAPDYSKGGFMRGNLVQLTLGGYLYETPGIIENISITLPDQATWEIGIPVNEEDNTRFFASPTRFTGDNVQELPHRLDISMTFRPIHNFLPQIVGSSYTVNSPTGSVSSNPEGINGGQKIKQRFLSLANGNPTIASANLYAGPQNGSGKYVGVPNQFKINDTSTAITSPTTQGQDIVAPETSTPLRFSSQVRRPGLGINQLSDEALINLGN